MRDEETAASVAPGPVSVAVVDDDPTARRLMRFWLERAGYQVVEHESARSVLDSEVEAPALACVDLGLGEVTGIKVIQHLKARDAELPIIVVTASGGSNEWQLLSSIGADRFLVKPVNLDDLISTIRRALRERSSGNFAIAG